MKTLLISVSDGVLAMLLFVAGFQLMEMNHLEWWPRMLVIAVVAFISTFASRWVHKKFN